MRAVLRFLPTLLIVTAPLALTLACDEELVSSGDSAGANNGGQGGQGNNGEAIAGFAAGRPMRCIDGQSCPAGCTCDTPQGLGTCNAPNGDACRYGEHGQTGDAPAFTDLAGMWTETYVCVNTTGCEYGDAIEVDMSQDGDALVADFLDGSEPLDGDLQGPFLLWHTTTDEYEETGLWTFEEAHRLTKVSVWQTLDGDLGGDCIGIATKQPDPAPTLQNPSLCF